MGMIPYIRSIALALSIAGLGCGEGSTTPSGHEPLLTDAELLTPADPSAAVVDPAWEQWIRDHHFPIRSLTSERFDDLGFLKSVIGSRRIVQLGESGHGVSEFSKAKVRLIKYLHEQMGFDVMAFESGLFDCWKAQQLADPDPEQTMSQCLFGVWNTDEVLELFAYMKETRATARPLILAGVDIAASGSLPKTAAADLFAEVVGKIDTAYAARARTAESQFQQHYSSAASRALIYPAQKEAIMNELEAKYGLSAKFDTLYNFLSANIAALKARYPEDPRTPVVARQAAFSRLQVMKGSHIAGFIEPQTHRDRGMAENLDVLLDELYPGKKVIVWAHNAHIMHDRVAMRRVNSFATFPQSMGSFVAAKRRAQLYTVGLLMYRGQAAYNSGEPYTITPALPGSVEATLYRARKQSIFVDMLGQTRTAGNAWMFEATPVKEWGLNDYRFVPRAQFDGILFIDTVNPPRYVFR